MTKVLMFGTTMFSAELQEILNMEGKEVVGYIIDRDYLLTDYYNELPVYPFEDIESCIDVSSTEIALTLGYSKMNEHRASKYAICKKKGYNILTYVSRQAHVFTDKIGEGSIVLPGTYIGPFSEIGKCAVIRPGSVFSHHDVIGNYNWIADGCTFGGGVKMGDHCFLGLGTTVRNGITISDYTLACAQTYLGRDTEKFKAYKGVPAKEVTGKTAYEVVCNI